MLREYFGTLRILRTFPMHNVTKLGMACHFLELTAVDVRYRC
jgi:hypothetical protein